MRKLERIDQKKSQRHFLLWVFIAFGLFILFSLSPIAAQTKPPIPPDVPEGVEFYDNEGHGHLPANSRSFYKTDPPTSGPHDPSWLPPSVYEASETRPELLVHNLEHGNIVIYFDQSGLSESDIQWLKEMTREFIGQWDGVLMVTREDKAHPLIITAWRAIFRLKALEKAKVLKFIDTFRGRGPENPVR